MKKQYEKTYGLYNSGASRGVAPWKKQKSIFREAPMEKHHEKTDFLYIRAAPVEKHYEKTKKSLYFGRPPTEKHFGKKNLYNSGPPVEKHVEKNHFLYICRAAPYEETRWKNTFSLYFGRPPMEKHYFKIFIFRAALHGETCFWMVLFHGGPNYKENVFFHSVSPWGAARNIKKMCFFIMFLHGGRPTYR